MTGLERLELPFPNITDRTLDQLAGLTRLRVFNLAYTNGIGDAELAILADLTRLEYLHLSSAEWRRTSIIDDGLRHLAGCYSSAAPGEVLFNRFPMAKKRKLATIYRAFIRWGTLENLRPGKPSNESHSLPGIEALSWRYKTDDGRQYLDFAW